MKKLRIEMRPIQAPQPGNANWQFGDRPASNMILAYEAGVKDGVEQVVKEILDEARLGDGSGAAIIDRLLDLNRRGADIRRGVSP